MKYEDFIRKEETSTTPVQEEISAEKEEGLEDQPEEIDVQKAVVEALAADKAERELEIEVLRKEKEKVEGMCEELKTENSKFENEINVLKAKIDEINAVNDKLRKGLENVGELLSKNSELPISNQIALLDRNTELDDKFEGETRDHVIEVIREARDASEKDGRYRRAQILESVLVANEPCGELAKRRAALEKLFEDNQCVINGQVINELDKLDISYKVGENYLLAKEIVKRTY